MYKIFLSFVVLVILSPCYGEASPVRKIAFSFANTIVSAEKGIHIIDEDGSNRALVTDAFDWFGYPDVSPDGTRIVFVAVTEGQTFEDIWVVNLDSSNLVKLVGTALASFPTWSPDGTKIAFSRRRPDSLQVWQYGSVSDIFVMDVNEGNVTNVTADHSRGGKQPAWSPDGSKFAYMGSGIGLAVMNSDGANPVSLQPEINLPTADPAWSPDGARIAFSAVYDESPIGNREYTGIFLIDPDGSNLTQLTHPGDLGPGTTVRDRHPAWSPDGTKIVFDSTLGGGWDIWVMNSDGSNRTKLTWTSHAAFPSWFPVLDLPTAIVGTSWGRIKSMFVK